MLPSRPQRRRSAVLAVVLVLVVAIVTAACGSTEVDDSPEARALGAAQLARTAQGYLVAPTGFRLVPAEEVPGGAALRDQLVDATRVDPGFVDISFRWILGGGDALVGQLIVTVLDPRTTDGDRRAYVRGVSENEGVDPEEVRLGDRALLRYGRTGDTSYLWQDEAVFVYVAGPDDIVVRRFLAAYVDLAH